MASSHTPSCPACNSRPEEMYMGGVFIVCSKTGCNISTDKKENLIEAYEAWSAICKWYPKPVPEDDETELI